ncbi:SDR family oxidoreductase [Flavobacterium aquicola]|uniref:NAD(P)-dependent dehydrogenase (Short-subunit alcohol dehydrogenase family) n=1 Tax=Flavobacterium aquicola TaxID=1682742 RepID=A0A3E0EDK6_9FLAO|nr:SDR family oxidoreductase [Flavobacterium aquicola]REG96321.1 NAD(P)-dependent dehydrogenase (short-subunit alcohol dehydrogenase family) [Flavobacterium aquicola]
MDFLLNDKVIVVTGATGILGGAFVDGIAEAGAAVGILGRNEKIANERVKAINDKGGKAIALIADVTKESDLIAARDLVLSKYGKIDGLVNAAGGNMPDAVVQPNEDIFKLNMDALQQVMNLNLFGTLLPTQIFGEAIKDTAGRGSIVNISSVSTTAAMTKVLGYSLAKSAIDSYTKWFAVELAKRYGDRIRMNSIAPGFFLTEQNRTLLTNEDGSLTERGNLVIQNTPYGRFGNPDELIGGLVWLLSDASKFATGSKVTLDGGFTIFSGV